MLMDQNFSMYQRETKNIIIAIDGVTDLVGSTIKWAMHKSGGENVLTKETPQITVSGNEITILLNPNDTDGLIDTYFHECKVIDQQGNSGVLFTGLATIFKSSL
jgi:hypothetical protein